MVAQSKQAEKTSWGSDMAFDIHGTFYTYFRVRKQEITLKHTAQSILLI